MIFIQCFYKISIGCSKIAILFHVKLKITFWAVYLKFCLCLKDCFVSMVNVAVLEIKMTPVDHMLIASKI